MTFKPMLAAQAVEHFKFPLLASPKLDGVRATVIDGHLRSRSLKPFANRHVQQAFSQGRFDGLDGEFILGDPTAEGVYRETNAALSRIAGNPTVTFWVFDDWSHSGGFQGRFKKAEARVSNLHGQIAVELLTVPHVEVADQDSLDQLEHMWTSLGYEGVMLRSLDGPYKFGRSTAKEGHLLKLKRYEDAEAIVLGVEEEMHNGNEATTNELGRTKRSSHQANKVGKGTMGALRVVGLNGDFKGVEFHIGTGFTAEDRSRLDWVGKVVKFKYFPVGVKDKPRHPVYLGERMQEDIE